MINNLDMLLFDRITMVANLTFAQLKARYRRTYAGLLWVLLNPIMTFWVQALIFKIILKVNIENYYIFLLTGIVPWLFMSSSLTMTVGLFINNRNALMAFKFDPTVFLLAQILDNFINYILSFLILMVFIHDPILLKLSILFYFIINSILLCFFVYYLSFILAIINVFYRDTQYILQFCLSLLYFITPIFYPRAFLDEHYSFLVDLNPFYVFIELFQNSIWKLNMDGYYIGLLRACGITLSFALVSHLMWTRKKNVMFMKL